MAASLTSTDLTLDNTSGASIPGTPAAGQTVLYPKDDKLLYYKNDAGQELPPGKVVQVVNFQTGAVATGTTVMPGDDTIPQITEGDQYMSQTFTPTNANNILLIDVVMIASINADVLMGIALFRDAVADALASAMFYPRDINSLIDAVCFRHKMAAGGTSEITFRIRSGGSGASTVTFNGRAGARVYGGALASSITITELTP